MSINYIIYVNEMWNKVMSCVEKKIVVVCCLILLLLCVLVSAVGFLLLFLAPENRL